MAYVDWSQVKEVDCSKPYKTFIDLKDGDAIFLIDFKELELKTLYIENISSKENNAYKINNRFEVSFVIPGIEYVCISDGNKYLDKVHINYKDEYITTDNRIAEVIIDLLRSRNSYQWNCLTGIFGNPTNKYAEKEIRLG
jgi:hypothetical protein